MSRPPGRARIATAGIIAMIVLASGVATLAYVVADRLSSAAAAPAAPPGTAVAGRALAPRVADLMARAHCAGAVIGTQLYSRETGRCQLAGAEVTIAAFTTNALRDQWVNFGPYGGNLVVGQLWAATVEKPDQARQLAHALGGELAS